MSFRIRHYSHEYAIVPWSSKYCANENLPGHHTPSDLNLARGFEMYDLDNKGEKLLG